MQTRKIYKLVDKSIVLGTEVENNVATVTIKAPLNVTQMFNPQTGQPEIAIVPLDLVFADVEDNQNSVQIRKDMIMWEKEMKHFKTYEQNYIAETTGIETVSSGIIQ